MSRMSGFRAMNMKYRGIKYKIMDAVFYKEKCETEE